MSSIILTAGWFFLSIIISGIIGFVITSIIEKKVRPVVRIISVSTPFLIIFIAILLFDFLYKEFLLLFIIAISLVTAIILILPFGADNFLKIVKNEQKRVDEREAIFHRFYRLKPGMPEYNAFYSEFPEKKDFDDKLRKSPNIAEPGTKTFNKFTSPMQKTLMDLIARLKSDFFSSEMNIPTETLEVSPEDITKRIKGFAHYLGADLIGTTKLNKAYIYSNIGRSPGKWGASIELDHKYAIAIGIKMDSKMIYHAPESPTATETFYKYFVAAKIALAISRYIQLLGYEARAHVDGNYRVLCPPIAADAGLGELGRLGLLITPEFGPRVRLSVVTTNIPLKVDKPITFGVQDFCEFCKKCGENCPTGSISMKAKIFVKGIEKWQSNQEKCYKFWRKQGTDCSICLKVCPYSHPHTLMHNIIRFAIKRNNISRRLALLLDDFFYGRYPNFKSKFPKWHDND